MLRLTAALLGALRPCCGLTGRPGPVLSSRGAKLRRIIGSAAGFGGRLPVAACWQPGISRAACAAAEIADRQTYTRGQAAISRSPERKPATSSVALAKEEADQPSPGLWLTD